MCRAVSTMLGLRGGDSVERELVEVATTYFGSVGYAHSQFSRCLPKVWAPFAACTCPYHARLVT
jgi:hypothetical protein